MKFKPDDHVRIIAPDAACFDAVGLVSEVLPGVAHPFRIQIPGEYPGWYGPNELILAENPNPFSNGAPQ